MRKAIESGGAGHSLPPRASDEVTPLTAKLTADEYELRQATTIIDHAAVHASNGVLSCLA